MSNRDKILRLAEKNHGVLLTKQLLNAKLPRWPLQSLVDEGQLIHVQRGVYVTQDTYIDDFFLLQLRFPNGIYSHETALYLLGYSDRAPLEITMTFKHGISVTRIKKENIRPIMVSNHYDLGIIKIDHENRTVLNVYNIERCLVDLLRARYDADREQLIPALKRYAQSKDKDINRLFNYAKIFDVETKLRNYMEVLL
ncbi:MAG: type IV toxin-antitoxin system AbiEi family antitoxin domain-containing protein [Eubacteriaceae bacterium]